MRAALAVCLVAGCGRIGFDATDDGGGGGSRVIAIFEPTEFTTASPTFVDVPNGRVDFTPDAAGQSWVILVSAAISSTASAEVAAELRYTLDGVERGFGGAQTALPTDRESYTAFDLFRGAPTPHTIQVQLRDSAGGDTSISDLHIIAFSLPIDATISFSEATAPQNVPAGWAPYLSLDVTSTTPDDYLILGGVSGTEAPGTSNIDVHLRDPSGAIWPEDPLFNHRQCWYAFLWARTVHLDAPGSFVLEASAGNVDSTLQHAHLAAIRTDAFDAIENVADLPFTPSNSTTGQRISALTTAAPAGPRDYIVLQHVRLEVDSSTFGHGARFLRDGSLTVGYQFETANAGNTAGVFDALHTSASMALENQFFVTDVAQTARAQESVIHALRLKP